MITFGMGITASPCKIIDLRWALKVRKLKLSLKCATFTR